MNINKTVQDSLTALQEAEAALVAILQKERSRKRADVVRKLHEVRQHLAPGGYKYTSQAGQDALVDRVLGKATGGTFVDIGGYDGVTGSNTLFFEQYRQWTGILVEPVPANLERAKAMRRCPCLGLAVSSQEGTADFIEVSSGYTQMSGLAGSYDPAMLDRVRALDGHAEATIQVPTLPLATILEEHGIVHPDYISLDVEGAEMDVLRDFPFERHRAKIWSIENNTASAEIGNVMRSAGYELIEFCGPDEIWHLKAV